MFKQQNINEYFEIIKKNHKEYLEKQMITHLSILGTENKKTLIDQYLIYINNFRELKKTDLDEDIRGATLAENIERGTFSALIGMLIGGLFFTATQRVPSMDLFGAKTAIQGGFATAIGSTCSVLMFSLWDKGSEKPAHADYKTCEEEMKKAGFTDERYAILSADLVKLFHFRECLLLGLDDPNNLNMRQAFKNHYYSSQNTQHFEDNDFNLAIEVYFLEQLNTLFQQAFEKIHEIHDKEINEEKSDNEFNLWFKRHFESSENRQKFTQAMQVQFIKQCVDFLKNQMNQPGFLGHYIYMIDFIAGLMTASLAVGIFAITTLFIPVFALISIAIATATLTALGTHLIITQTDYLYYKRDQNNRHAIQSAIESIVVEQKRLNTLLKTVVITTKKDLDELKKYDNNQQSCFLNILRGDSKKHIALGSVRAWIREFASRFNESKVVEIDLSERIEALIEGAYKQTVSLQEKLHSYIISPQSAQSALASLAQFINETVDYLKRPENAAFIKTFESIHKIKEQVLEIVGFIPSTLSAHPLPDILIKFYTDPISKGGLGGLNSDLEQTRRLAPVLLNKVTPNVDHPYQPFIDTAFTIQLKLNEYTKALFILQGDPLYRKMLGLPSNRTGRIEEQINTANIQEYLNESFNFLCLLNDYDKNIHWQESFQNTDAFILYRMLFIKQLANLTDPKNLRVDSLVKDIIKQFARTTLNYNPDVAFDDILNQALLIKEGKASGDTLQDKYGNPRLLSELAYIADALRVDMAYVLSPLSPEKLIALEAVQLLIINEDKIIFGYNAVGQLTPDPSKEFYDKINETIHMTAEFLKKIKPKKLLQQTSTIKLYLQVVSNEIERISKQIRALTSLLGNAKMSLEPLTDALNALDACKQPWELPEPIGVPTVNAEVPPADSPVARPQAENPADKKSPNKHRFQFSMFNLHKHTQNKNSEPPARMLGQNPMALS